MFRRQGSSPNGDAEGLRRVDRALEVAALAIIPLGITALVLGWFGVASTGHVFLQLPYLVSGGLVGVSLLLLGGMLYLASWVSRTSAIQRCQNEQIIRSLEALRQTVALGATTAPGAAPTANGAQRTFVATPRGSMFHRPECTVVTDRSDVRVVAADAADMRPCGMCDPLADDMTSTGATDR